MAGAAALFGIEISANQMANIQFDLETDLSHIQPFDDGLEAVEKLQAKGIKVAVASNLASPYGEPVQRFYPNLDGYGFSFSLGVMNPTH